MQSRRLTGGFGVDWGDSLTDSQLQARLHLQLSAEYVRSQSTANPGKLPKMVPTIEVGPKTSRKLAFACGRVMPLDSLAKVFTSPVFLIAMSLIYLAQGYLILFILFPRTLITRVADSSKINSSETRIKARPKHPIVSCRSRRRRSRV